MENRGPLLALTLHNVERMLSHVKSSLSAARPVDPLASFDVSGQWRLFMQTPHLTRKMQLEYCHTEHNTGMVRWSICSVSS